MERIGLAPGSEVGGYRIVAPLGAGGMGAVYRAVDGGGSHVALKLLHPHIGADPEARERLRREVSALQRLRHPAVAAVLDAEADSSEAFLVTELVEGENLARHVREHGPLDPQELAHVARRLLETLDAVHRAGVVHRDLKPSNVVVTSDGPVLIDFGIAQGMDEAPLTSTGVVLGTPGYLAPELLDGAEPDDTSDWWGWAAVLAFAATGREPFGARPVEAVLARARAGELDTAGLGPRTAAILRGALDADPARRTSPEEVVTSLERVAEQGDAADLADDDVPTIGGVDQETTRLLVQDGHTRALAGAAPLADAWGDDASGPDPVDGHLTEVYDDGVPEGRYDDALGDPHGGDAPAPSAGPVGPDDGPSRLADGPAPAGLYAPPVLPGRTGSLLALLGFAVVGGALAPGVVGIVVAAITLLLGTVDAAGSALETRRSRRGGPRRGDVLRTTLAWPWHALRGCARAVPSLLVAASVTVVVGGTGWWLLDTRRIVVAPVTSGGGTAPGGGNERWVYLAVLAIAMLAGLATLWGGPFARATRRGARRTLERIAPGSGGATVLVVGSLVGIAVIVVLLATGQPTWWWPLPGPPSLG